MHPSHQRFHAAEFPCDCAHARLIEKHKLVLFQRLQQCQLRIEPVFQVFMEPGLVEAIMALARALGGIHRHIRVFQQYLGIFAIAGEQADADGRTHCVSATR